MSPATARAAVAPAAAAGSAASRNRTARAPRPDLRLVAPPAPAHGRSAFVALVAVVLALGLGALLGLNTLLAQDAFVVYSLEQQRAELAVTEQALAAQLAEQEDPNRLAFRARALGLVPAGPPTFLRLPEGVVVGDRRNGRSR